MKKTKKKLIYCLILITAGSMLNLSCSKASKRLDNQDSLPPAPLPTTESSPSPSPLVPAPVGSNPQTEISPTAPIPPIDQNHLTSPAPLTELTLTALYKKNTEDQDRQFNRILKLNPASSLYTSDSPIGIPNLDDMPFSLIIELGDSGQKQLLQNVKFESVRIRLNLGRRYKPNTHLINDNKIEIHLSQMTQKITEASEDKTQLKFEVELSILQNGKPYTIVLQTLAPHLPLIVEKLSLKKAESLKILDNIKFSQKSLNLNSQTWSLIGIIRVINFNNYSIKTTWPTQASGGNLLQVKNHLKQLSSEIDGEELCETHLSPSTENIILDTNFKILPIQSELFTADDESQELIIKPLDHPILGIYSASAQSQWFSSDQSPNRAKAFDKKVIKTKCQFTCHNPLPFSFLNGFCSNITDGATGPNNLCQDFTNKCMACLSSNPYGLNPPSLACNECRVAEAKYQQWYLSGSEHHGLNFGSACESWTIGQFEHESIDIGTKIEAAKLNFKDRPWTVFVQSALDPHDSNWDSQEQILIDEMQLEE